VRYIESDKAVVGYIWIFTVLPLSFCLCSPFNCFRD